MANRIWDPFLTPQDMEHLSNSTHKQVGIGKKPALLNIDLYRAVFGDTNLPLIEGVKSWPSYCGPASWNAVPHIQAVQKAARSRNIPVIHITALAPEDSGVPGWFDAIHGGGRRKIESDEASQDRFRRRYEIVPEVGPVAGEVVLRKTAPSAFNGTPLLSQLSLLGIDTLFVTGESTSGCVRASVVDAASYRFKVQVIEDCVFDRHQACHAINLFDMNEKYADVISAEMAISYLKSFDA